MNPIEIKVKRSYYTRLIPIGIFTLGIGALLMYLEHRRWGQTFDSVGVTRIDGKRFLWSDLQKKIFVHWRRYAGGKLGPLNHVELKFNNGNVKVFPLMLENASDVMAYIEKFQVEEQVVAPSS
jgi:hypothetical protein